MHLVLTGATGWIGYGVLQHCLANANITRLSILSRRSFELPSDPHYDTSKANIIVHKDYTSYPSELLNQLKGAEGIVWAQGISQTQVNQEEYVRITFEYPLAAAKAFATLNDGKPFKFVHVSGEGADPDERAWTLYGNIKGRTERTLIELPHKSPELGALCVFNVRPGAVDPPVRHKPELLIKRLVIPLVRTFLPSQTSPTPELSRVLVDLALGDGKPLRDAPGIEAGGRTVRSKAIRTAQWESIYHSQQPKHEDL